METTEELERRVRTITHDLNNALGLVINYAVLVSNDLEDRPELAADLAEIRDAGSHAAELVKELSTLLRGEPAQS